MKVSLSWIQMLINEINHKALEENICGETFSFGTCSCAHAPRGQAVRCCEAVEHADILRYQKLHKLRVLERLSFAAEDGGSLVGNVDNPSGDQRYSYCKNILLTYI